MLRRRPCKTRRSPDMVRDALRPPSRQCSSGLGVRTMARLVSCALVAFAAVAAPTLTRADDLPNFWDLKPEQLRVLVASPQVMVTRTSSGWDAYCRCPVILKPHEIPDVMKKAIIAVEDRRYYKHHGVDLIGLLSMMKGGFRRGASTITMQLLKNLVFHDLRRKDIVSTLERKGAEIWNAGTFDSAVGKEALLAAYLNQIEFGGREIVGLYRAARHYFRKEPKDLTAYEAAMLAGMVQAPGLFNPLKTNTKERAHRRAKHVLNLMVAQGKMTESERRRAEQIGVRPGILPEYKIQSQAFTEWVVQTWGARFVKEGETIRFFVTIEPRYQRLAERHLADLVSEGSVPAEYEAAAVMMTGDGRVRAMIGAIDWARSQFNSAVKGQVQAGSTAKLPVLIAACERGKTPNSRVDDRPDDRGWPSNGGTGYIGPTTIKEAFASSRNAAMVRLAQELGVGNVAEASRRLGIDPGPKPDAGFVLGPFSTNVLAMTSAYASVANGGHRVTPTGVLAVVDGRGQVRGTFLDTMKTRVIAQRCIEPTRSMLRAVVQTGTGRKAALRRWQAYGKTGTTSGNADAWFIGWSEGRVLGVWMGKRRDAIGGAIAGKDAPAEFFRRVSSDVNDMVEYRHKQERRKEAPAVAAAPRSSGRKAASPIVRPKHTSGQVKNPSARPQFERRTNLEAGIDPRGGDYRVLRDVGPQTCEGVCIRDRRCRDFAYDRHSDSCFLKSWARPGIRRGDTVPGIMREQGRYDMETDDLPGPAYPGTIPGFPE